MAVGKAEAGRKGTRMKRSIAAILLLALALSLTGCVETVIDFGKPVRNDKETVKTKYGDEFIISVVVNDFPSQKTILTASHSGQDGELLSIRAEGHDSYYAYEKYDYYDIVENPTEIVAEYKDDDLRAYLFNWGMVYSSDGGVTFSGVAKHEYNARALEEDDVGPILSKLGIRLFNGRPYKPDQMIGKSRDSIIMECIWFDQVTYDINTLGEEIIKEGSYDLWIKTSEGKLVHKAFVIVFENDIATEAYITNALSD